jgi:hypothetical protein
MEASLEWSDSILSSDQLNLCRKMSNNYSTLSFHPHSFEVKSNIHSHLEVSSKDDNQDELLTEQQKLLLGYHAWLELTLKGIQEMLDKIEETKSFAEEIKSLKRKLTLNSQQMNAHVQNLMAQRVIIL